MPLFLASLNSGSNGNCYFVGNQTDAVLIDAGLSCRETERRMARLNLSMQSVRAIFISHEHSDHISGLSQLAKKYQLPVYITPGTLESSRLPTGIFPINDLRAHERVRVGSLTVTAFPKWHDAADPHSFVVTDGIVNIGIFTDIGEPCEHVIHYFGQCHAAILEANYDEDMLANGRYPYFLKRRIQGQHGHLSNQQALALFQQHRPSFMSHLLLGHLSKDNNNPELVRYLFEPHLQETQFVVASRYSETKVFSVG